jgi:hypothetical protein
MNDLHKLLQLKRYEHPSSDYFERFLDEFQERQRAELLRQSSLSLFWERLVNLVSDFQVPRMAYASVAAAAVVLSAAILFLQSEQPAPESAGSFALNNPQPTVNVLPAGRGDLRLPASSRSQFPPYYVLETRPVSYESPYSF